MVFTHGSWPKRRSCPSFLDRFEMGLINERFNAFEGESDRVHGRFWVGRKPFGFITICKEIQLPIYVRDCRPSKILPILFPPLHLIKVK
jgi:hypothetical protein